MKAEFKSITPAIAEQLLKVNRINRVISEPKVNEYCRQMMAGLWKEETGEAIKIATDGSLLDGQHRLSAMIKAGLTLNFLVITGLEKEVFSVLDSGKIRSSGDVLHIAGVPNAKTTAAAIRRYISLSIGNVGSNNFRPISNSETLSHYRSRVKFWDAATLMGKKWYNDSNRILSETEIIAMYAKFWDINEDDAFNFFTKLCTGVGLAADDPIYLLREKLLFAKLNTRFNLIQSIRTALVIKAWNYTRTGKKVRVLKFDIERDEYPVAI